MIILFFVIILLVFLLFFGGGCGGTKIAICSEFSRDSKLHSSIFNVSDLSVFLVSFNVIILVFCTLQKRCQVTMFVFHQQTQIRQKIQKRELCRTREERGICGHPGRLQAKPALHQGACQENCERHGLLCWLLRYCV